MSKAPHIKFETPEEVQHRVLEVVKAVSEGRGMIRKGINEVTKSIDRSQAKLVVIAEEVNPPEVVMHLPKLAEEKGIPFVYVKAKLDLGKAAGLNVPTSSISIVDVGNAGEGLNSLLKIVKTLNSGNAEKEAKPEPKAEKPKEEKKEKAEKKEEKAEKKEAKEKPKSEKKEKPESKE